MKTLKKNESLKTEIKKEIKFPGKTALIVEDVESNYSLLDIILKRLEIKTLWAKDGNEAIQLCLSDPDIDLVLMDIKMPNMNGYEATKIIKKTHPELPIIAVTAFALYGDDEKAAGAGCDDYITKPIKKEIFLEKIEKYLGKP